MKTGRDSNRSGLYISECCLKEAAFLKGQMFSRCPRCSALTVWEFVKRVSSQTRDTVHLFPKEFLRPRAGLAK
jgi:hypothetical protein